MTSSVLVQLSIIKLNGNFAYASTPCTEIVSLPERINARTYGLCSPASGLPYYCGLAIGGELKREARHSS
jgi:hypothetical protein